MKSKIKKIILKPMDILYKIAPEFEVKLMFFFRKGYWLSDDKPLTYDEKLNWLKIHYRNELMVKCADKYTVRDYITQKGYGDKLPQLLWQGYDAKDIPFNQLPEKFVIKTTHGSGYNIICKRKEDLDIQRSIKMINKWLKEDYLLCYGEWFYGKVKPRIIIEEFLSEDGKTPANDYKFYCFNNYNGKHDVGVITVHGGRGNDVRSKGIFTNEWEPMDIEMGYIAEKKIIMDKPKQIEEMKEIAINLSSEFPHARIDFYLVNNRIYIGEITFIPSAGFSRISPNEFDQTLGSWISLPNQIGGK